MLSFDQFLTLTNDARAGGAERLVVPVYKRRSADLLTPVSAFLSMRRPGTYPFLLESVEGGERKARYTFLGKEPYRVVEARGRRITVREAGTTQRIDGDLFAYMQAKMDEYEEVQVAGLPRFSSGAVGYLGYDGVRLVEHLPDTPADDLHLPDGMWCFYDTVAAFDHVKNQLVLMASVFVEPDTDLSAGYRAALRRIERLEAELAAGIQQRPVPVTLGRTAMVSNIEKNAFMAAVERAKEYIYEGDIFQVVLSQRFETQFSGDRFNLYRALRQVNPSPYLFYLDFETFALVGSSPEVLVRIEDGRAELLPIAGTRPRGATPEADAQLAEELLADPKEQAEHVMLVDLGRNDLGRVCAFETVTVDRFAYVERYSHVMHIVSEVSGELDQSRGAMDVLAACFPAGTVSGAPKVRAMEIIDELEPSKRGIYAGAVGYLDFSGNMDTCIAIRTMVVQGPHVYVQAGAGIVADSNPELEFEETVNKAKALKQAMLVAAEGLL
ncbi:MAG: anthranilate synthase component I [Bacteroidota bacterium]